MTVWLLLRCSPIRRYPEAVRNSLCQLGRLVFQESFGCELSFVTDIVGDVANGFAALKLGVKDRGYFKHQVWRILFYGSSITNGASPTLYHLSYIQQAARHLKADSLNQGLSGACLYQPEVADYLAERVDWDMIGLSALKR